LTVKFYADDHCATVGIRIMSPLAYLRQLTWFCDVIAALLTLCLL